MQMPAHQTQKTSAVSALYVSCPSLRIRFLCHVSVVMFSNFPPRLCQSAWFGKEDNLHIICACINYMPDQGLARARMSCNISTVPCWHECCVYATHYAHAGLACEAHFIDFLIRFAGILESQPLSDCLSRICWSPYSENWLLWMFIGCLYFVYRLQFIY